MISNPPNIEKHALALQHHLAIALFVVAEI